MFDRVRDTASDLVMSAMTFLGVPYRRGGTSVAAGFDCSGFTRHVFEQSIGRLLPRQSRDQALAADLLTIRREELKPGDLVFFNTMRRAFSHVGIYVGDGKFIHAPRTGSEVRVDDMRQAYWTQRFNGARRLPELEGSTWRLPPLLPSAVAAPRSAEAESASPR
ncbi:MAG: C40 family peptidase [Burkholderiaceae bacterium]|nr:C40 family peptidase [Burkholderiaceae bacterium]